jgi:hypothetical protein
MTLRHDPGLAAQGMMPLHCQISPLSGATIQRQTTPKWHSWLSVVHA